MSVPATSPRRGATGRGAHSGYERLAKGLGLFSIGLGLAEMFGARPLCRALGLERHETLIRVYGAREFATGVAILMSHDPTPWMIGRVVGDAVDLATLATGFEGDNARSGNLLLATAAVAGVTVLDGICVGGLTADKALSAPGTWDYSDRTGFPKSPAAMRGVARDLEVPADFRIPDPLRPWTDGEPAVPVQPTLPVQPA